MPEPTLINLKDIKPNPYQPRTDEDQEAITEIAINIYRNGLMQIPSARRVNSHYELVFGHTRKAAYALLSTKGVPSADIAPDKRYAEMPLYVHELDDRQMFEMAVAENIKRRDLNAIEQATAMQRYMNEFDATSKQAAELFGVNDATVRGKVRLLELPEPVQLKLAAGELSESAARGLLSLQKIAPEAKVIEAVKNIEKNKGNALPEEVIENSIEHLENTVDLWNDNHRDGKPRAGYHGWLLDMKNFPNHLLPAMNEQAVGAFEKRLDHLMNPPACTACPFYTKIRGSHFCGMKYCFERKMVAWQQNYVEQASKKTKIPIYKEEDGAYRPLDYYEVSRKLFEKKHKDLRLISKQAIGHYTYQSYTGLDDDLVVVVATGEELLGKMVKESGTGGRIHGGKKSEKEKAEMRAMKVYRIKRKELMWEYTAAAQRIFESVPLDALKKLNQWEHILIDDSIPEEYDHPQTGNAAQQLAYQRRALVWRMIMNKTSHLSRCELSKALNTFADITGVKAPTSLIRRAEEWDAEIKAAASVSTATGKGKKT